jgi:catechol 2,3-dioxygenase-like lactoylglutathione lyase family enzyme
MSAVRYLVDDVGAAVDFYVGVMGFEMVERWGPPFAMVCHGDLTLWLSGPGSSASRPLGDGSKPVPSGWNRMVIEVTGLESMVERLKRSGAHLRGAIVAGPGGKQVLVDDPSGNPVELFEPGDD